MSLRRRPQLAIEEDEPPRDDGKDVLLDALVCIIHNASQITREQAVALYEALEEHHPDLLGGSRPGAVLYGPNFDLTHEVNAQLAIVNSMRNAMIDSRTQSLREGVTTREAKELVTASNTLMTTLTKAHKDIINAERQRAVEEAVIRYASSLEDEEKAKFLAGLEEELEKLE